MGRLGVDYGRLHMDDVYLEGAIPEGTAVVGHLSVTFDEDGLTVVGPSPDARRTVTWDRLSALEFGPEVTLPDGDAGTSMLMEVDGRPLRLLVPSTGQSSVRMAELRPEAPPTPPVEVLHFPTPAPALDPAPEHVLEPEPEPMTTPAPPAPVAEASAVAPAPPAPVPVIEPVPPAPVVEAIPAPAPPTMMAPPAPPPPPAPLVPPPPPAPVEPAATGTEAPLALAGGPTLADVLYPRAPVGGPTLADAPPPTVAAVPAPDDDVDDEPLSRPGVAGGLDARFDEWPVNAHGRRVVPVAGRRRRRRASFRSVHLRRVALVTVLLGLIPIAGGVWYFHYRVTSSVPPGEALADAAIAIRVGIQPSDLPGWKSSPTQAGNVFAAGASTAGPLAASTAAQESTVVARCLHVPLSALQGAFSMAAAASLRTAEVASPAYADPRGGGTASSVVDVVATSDTGNADAQVFANPSLFATCYQPYAQAMLPYGVEPGTPPGGFSTATVQPVVVPLPYSPDVQVAAFQIARIGQVKGQTVNAITIAVAVFGGRAQASVDMSSSFVFPVDTQLQLVRAIEARVVGVDQY